MLPIVKLKFQGKGAITCIFPIFLWRKNALIGLVRCLTVAQEPDPYTASMVAQDSADRPIRVTIDCRSQSFEIRARRADRTSRRSDPIPLALYRIRQFSNCFCPPNRPALAGQLASARCAVVACQGRVLTFGCGPHHPCPATIDSPGQDRGSGLRPHHSVPSEICISARSESRGVAHRRKEGTKPETSHHKGQIYDQHT